MRAVCMTMRAVCMTMREQSGWRCMNTQTCMTMHELGANGLSVNKLGWERIGWERLGCERDKSPHACAARPFFRAAGCA
eukprot:318218-Chlamydomonas_euryale.AAC.1